MAWKDNSTHILIRRKYRCDVCEHIFEARHESPDEPPPDCPACVQLGQAVGQPLYIPPMPGIGTTKGKAIDLAQQMAEEDYGLTDMNDNQRAGDIAFKGPAPMQTAESDQLIHTMAQYAAQTGAAPLPEGPRAPDGTRQVLVDPALQAQNYWQGNAGGSAEGTVGQGAAAKAASDAAKAQGIDPVGILEAGRQSGNMPLRLNVMGAENDIPAPLAEAQAKRGAMP